ncbi:MAG: cobalt-zinc-cadmium efflux system protein [Pseudomonadota bacterium]|nr:cobalt-zinc-cadmium efflux system protein [Pseudomonadota bacterium]
MPDKYSNYLNHEEYQQGKPHDENNHNNIKHHHEHSHNHNHASHINDTNSKVLAFCLLITFLFAFVEGIGGYLTHSIALKSDAVHMLTDAAGLLIAYIANAISKKPATVNLTFGYGKAEALGALINCVFTLVLTLGLLIEVVSRFFIPVEVNGSGLFIIAGIGLLINALVAYVLAKNSHSLNIKAALIHTLGDLLASVVAIVAGLVIIYTGKSITDPILSLIVVFILIISNYNLLKKSSIVLMAGVPDHIDYEEVGRDIEAIDNVIGIHDLHIWYLTANTAALSAHIIATSPITWETTLLECQKMLKDKHNIEHVTLQHEFNHNPEMAYCEVR